MCLVLLLYHLFSFNGLHDVYVFILMDVEKYLNQCGWVFVFWYQ